MTVSDANQLATPPWGIEMAPLPPRLRRIMSHHKLTEALPDGAKIRRQRYGPTARPAALLASLRLLLRTWRRNWTPTSR
jgi:hypothetical protein